MEALDACGPMQKLLLRRLGFMVRRRAQEAALQLTLREEGRSAFRAEEMEARLQLLDKAIYSNYVDCVDAGVGEEARLLLEALRRVLS